MQSIKLVHVIKLNNYFFLDGGKFDPINHGATSPDSLLEVSLLFTIFLQTMHYLTKC